MNLNRFARLPLSFDWIPRFVDCVSLRGSTCELGQEEGILILRNTVQRVGLLFKSYSENNPKRRMILQACNHAGNTATQPFSTSAGRHVQLQAATNARLDQRLTEFRVWPKRSVAQTGTLN